MRKTRTIVLSGLILTLGAAALAAQVLVDGGFRDWQDVPAMAAFSPRFNPVYFRRETGGEAENRRIAEAEYWEKGGTRIRELKSVIDERAGVVSFYLEVHAPFSRETSFFLYPYADRETLIQNRFTVELVPQVQGRAGVVLLWEKGAAAPRSIGELASGSIRLECSIALGSLPASFVQEDLSALSFDLTSCFHEQASGLYEEFFFTTIYFDDMSRPGE